MIFNFNGLSWVDNDHNIAFILSSNYNTISIFYRIIFNYISESTCTILVYELAVSVDEMLIT